MKRKGSVLIVLLICFVLVALSVLVFYLSQRQKLDLTKENQTVNFLDRKEVVLSPENLKAPNNSNSASSNLVNTNDFYFQVGNKLNSILK